MRPVKGRKALGLSEPMERDGKSSGEPTGRWMVTKVMIRTEDGSEVIRIHYGAPLPPPEPAPEG